MRDVKSFIASALLIGAVFNMARGQDVRLGVVTDFDKSAVIDSILRAMVFQIDRTVGSAKTVTLSPEDIVYSINTLAKAGPAYTSLSPKVDFILLIGSVSIKGQLGNPFTRPTIGLGITDPKIQEIPITGDKSGVKNFSYIWPARRFDNEVFHFNQLYEFGNLAVLVDQASMATFNPEIGAAAMDSLSRSLSTTINVVPISNDVVAAIESLPPATDAVYITNLYDKPQSVIRQLAYELKKRKLPSFSLNKAYVDSGILACAMYGFTRLAFVFFPDSDRNTITIDINLPEGTKIETTEETVLAIEKYMQDELRVREGRPDGILDWSAYIGKGPSSYDLGYSADEPNSNYAHILVNTSNFIVNADVVSKLDAYCFTNFPNADIKVGFLGSGGGGTPIEIKVSGDNPDNLARIAEKIKKHLFQMNGTKNIKDDWGPKGKKFVIDIDQNKSQLAGITNQDVAISLQTVLDGFRAGEFREEDKSIPIVMLSDEGNQQSLSSLETLNIYSQNSGKSVPLLQVANIVPQWQYSKIKRLDLTRTINVSSELTEDGNASSIVSQITPWLDNERQSDWGQGYTYEFGGDAKNTAENMGAVAKYLPLSAFIIVMLLIIQFNSFRKMTMIVCTIPLGAIGMVIGLLLFGVPFGFMAFLGVISLAGIVINNAIVLIDRIEIEGKELERNPQDAVIAACLQRFRPILLATFTTVLGLVPLYLGGGEMWEPMAVTIMIGLLFGTVITLLFIPVFYSILYRVDFHEYTFNESLLSS